VAIHRMHGCGLASSFIDVTEFYKMSCKSCHAEGCKSQVKVF